MKSIFLFIAMTAVLCTTAFGLGDEQFGHVNEYCEVESLDDPVPHIGSVHALMILASCDSALGSTECLPVPFTHAMPSWKDLMFDESDDHSLSAYYSDISYGNHILTGEVRGRTADQVFVAPIRPLCPGSCYNNTGGIAFFDSIMTRADSVIDFNEFDLDDDGVVDYLFFCMYGFCWGDWNCKGTHGCSGLAGTFTSKDTLSNGDSVRIVDGSSFWAPAEDAYSGDADNAYWLAHGVAAHEYGHDLGLSHWCAGENDPFDEDSSDHRAFGCFDVMCSGSFGQPDASWHQGYTSPFVPYARVSLSWATPQLVDQPIWNIEMEDFTLTGELLKIPASTSQSNNQYFLVQSATRRRIWEQFWPSEGVLIYHVNPSGVQCNRKKKLADQELASGLWNWNLYHDAVDTAWHSTEDSLWAGERTTTRNTVSGLDSFDVIWAHHAPYLQGMFPRNRAGSAANYFRSNMVFSDTSNPSSRAYQDTLQNLATMIHVKVNLVDTVNHTCYITAWNRHWSGTVEENAYWTDEVVVDGDLVVPSNATLTILPGTKVTVLPNVLISFYGDIELIGTLASPILFDCSDTNATWAGLRVFSDDEDNILKHVIVRHAYFGVMTAMESEVAAHLAIDSCEFSKCTYGVVFSFSGGVLAHSHLHDNTRFGAVIVDNRVNISHNTIEDNGQGGIRLVRGSHTLSYNTIQDNGIAQNPEWGVWGGVENLGAALTLNCNEIHHNEGPGLYTFWSGLSMMHDGAWNQIYHNMLAEDSLGYDFGQVHAHDGIQTLAYGLNSIYTDIMGIDVDTLVRFSTVNPVAWNYAGNYWGSTDTTSIASRLPPNTTFIPMYSSPQNCLTEQDDSLNDTPTTLFKEALVYEDQSYFTSAIVNYDSLIKYTTDHQYKGVSIDRMAFCQRANGWSWDDIRGFYLDLSETIQTPLVNQCLGTAAWCLVNLEDFGSAIYEFAALVDSSTNEQDSIRNQLSLILLELRLHDDGLFSLPGRPNPSSGNVDDIPAACTDLAGIAFGTAVGRMDALISSRREKGIRSTDEITLPTSFALYQNYPNPFNPTTEIKFDLPEAINVELKIFNIVGQEIATLINETRLAGVQTVSWDGKSATGATISSGVYVYQLKAGNFMDAKKMMLLK